MIPSIKPANRLLSVQEYYFSTKLKEIAQMNKEGKDVISLGIGMPDLPPSEATISALTSDAQKPNVHGYQSYNGTTELRQAFAQWYGQWYGVKLNPDQEILPLMGSKEGILHVSLAFLNPGDGVLVPNPGYPTYASVSKLVEAEVIYYDLDEQNHWYPDFDALEKLDLTHVKLMWVNYPNMPTGAPANEILFDRLIDFGKRHGILICNDNPYSFILNDRPLSMLSRKGAMEGCLELNSMSKSHNMSGWRVGMLAGNARFVEWVLRVKSNIDSGMFHALQIAAVEALHNDPEWHRMFNFEVYARRRIIAENIVQALNCSFDPKQTGMFLWAKIPEIYTDAGVLADEILYQAHVFVTPGFIFGSNGNRFIRISLCSTEEKLKEALTRILKMKKEKQFN
ncbi:MAG: pyridoxal phosphate-dependent aminotransferase [Microbacter sp.]